MSKNLVIVESPAKAKTIEKYLGKDFTVKSSYGHVRDLPKDDSAIDIANGFVPKYVISDDKKQVVKELKKLAQEAEIVWLATDDDREGEAISWHLKEALELADQRIQRIVFREITKNAILKAIQTPRRIDIDLVNAQQARRVLDRLVGFELSPILWRKIKGGLSAGRVQSVAVRMVVEREREVEQFEAKSAYKISANFDLGDGKELKSELPKRFDTYDEALAFLQRCIGASFSIANLEQKPGKKSPAPPFTTSTLQQEASRKLNYPVSLTMSLAQKLYEAGHISYMRTDSVSLSEEALQGAAQAIGHFYGPEFAERRVYKTKSESAQEAHEAIRPTDFSKQQVKAAPNEQRLYELIWKRTVASQMADARLEKTVATIAISTTPEPLVATGEVIVFEGFLKVYLESTDDDEQEDGTKGMLPPLRIGQALALRQATAVERFSRPSARYTEASLVKKLEEMGIGRPSTYAPTISTIQKREYVVKDTREGKERPYREMVLQGGKISQFQRTEVHGAEKSKLFPTTVGMVVNDFLVRHFPNVVDYSFTAKVEEQFDLIANGSTPWSQMLEAFYKGFHQQVEVTANADRTTAGLERELGEDPATGKKVTVKLGKYGAYAQIGTAEDEEKPVFASLREGQLMETITLGDALELFKLPRRVGSFEGQEITAAIGRFGPYLKHAGKFVTLPKQHDPLTVDEPTAIGLIEAKRLVDSQKEIKVFEENPDVRVLNGRWGPYIAYKKSNFKIPKDKDAASLTLEECMAIIEAPQAPKKAPAKKKS
jgi:DNA topoisomerase-1